MCNHLTGRTLASIVIRASKRSVLSSFFSAGFEGTAGYDRNGTWFDQVVSTGHQARVDEDYAALAALGISSVRESVRWPLVDIGRGGPGRGRYDFSSLDPFLAAAGRHRVRVLWDLFHFGYPRDLDIWGPDFVPRFADYCRATALYIRERTDGPWCFAPVNEPSYFAYAAGEQALFPPYARGRADDLKAVIVRAAVAGAAAVRAACPGAIVTAIDPLCRVAAPDGRPDLAGEVAAFNEGAVFQAWDGLMGRADAGERGAAPDVIGVNYYWTCQWEWGMPPDAEGAVPPLADDDPRRLSLADLLRGVWQRYRRPILLAETGHWGDARPGWLRRVGAAAEELHAEGVPLLGVCLYPIIGMTDWHQPTRWMPLGLWDRVDGAGADGPRLLHRPTAEVLAELAHLDGAWVGGRL